MPKHLSTALIATLALAVLPLHAQGPYWNRDNRNRNDSGDQPYPVPYQLPTVAELTETLHRVRGYMEASVPSRVVDRKTKKEITDFTTPVADAEAERSATRMGHLAYEMGVIHSGMLKASAITGDPKFNAFTERQLTFIAEKLPYFKAQEEKFKLERANSFAAAVDPRALDDSGSMCAALIRARQAKVGPDLQGLINTWSDWVANKQFRLADGTLARQRPQAQSLWADDYYMSVPALAEMGRMTGKQAYFDDAAKNVLQMWHRLYSPQMGVLTHGWNANNPDAPHFYWARANGWAVLAISDLLDVLPKDHPSYDKIMSCHRLLLRGIAQYQSGHGLWHQMLDRNDSYLETSATAMFVYGYAHAINEGWISPTTYGSIAQAGWVGLSTKINAKGQVEGTCVGTTFASDQVYYYNRPTSVDAMHGYGPALLAGAEMIRLIKNPTIDIQMKLRTYHYVPKSGGETSYREHN